MIRSERTLAYLCVTITCVGWCLGPIFIRLLKDTYDPYTMPFVRYTAAAAPLLVLNLIAYRKDFLRLLARPRTLCALAMLNIAGQFCWTVGCLGSTATTALLIGKTDVVIIVVLAYFLFHEERTFIKHPAFVAGTLLSLLGVSAVLASDAGSRMPVFNFSSIMLLSTALIWSIYSIWAKHLVANIHPIPLFSVVAILTAGGYFFIAFAFGDPSTILVATPKMLFVTFLSGVIPLSISYPCFNYAQKHLGASFCSTATLTTPVLAYFLSAVLLPEESLLPVQIAGALVLIAGTFVVSVAHYRVGARREALAATSQREGIEVPTK